jgi:hypothetical protein
MWKDRRCGANRTPRPDRRAKWINVEAAAEVNRFDITSVRRGASQPV